MKKALKIILLVTFVLSLACSAVACGSGSSKKNDNTDTSMWDIQRVYAEAKELGYTGKLEDFLKEVTGKDGANGMSAYDLYKKYFTYEGTEKQWILDLINGTLIDSEETEVRENKTFENIFSNMNMETGFSADITSGGSYEINNCYLADTDLLLASSKEINDYSSDKITLKFKKTKDMAYIDVISCYDYEYNSYWYENYSGIGHFYLVQRKELSGNKNFSAYVNDAYDYEYANVYWQEDDEYNRRMYLYNISEYLSKYGKQTTKLLQKLGGEFVYKDGSYELTISSENVLNYLITWANNTIDSLTETTTVSELYNSSGIRQFILDYFTDVKAKDVLQRDYGYE